MKLVTKRKLTVVAVVLIAVWVSACGALYSLMRRPPERFASAMARMPGPVVFLLLPFETLWTHARAGQLHLGDKAPDFKLATLDHSGDVQLSAWMSQGRPVVLVFGSYT